MRQITLSQMGRLLHLKEPLPSTLVGGFSVDTRILKPGEIYFALPGERVDGHDFLKQAKQLGACAAVVSTNYAGPDFDLCLIRVPDPLKALQEIARQILKQTPVRIVAITGSLGKTTTKEFVKTLLKAKYHVAASPGNSNSQIGIPLSILNHTDGTEEILVLEMGMTKPGHILDLLTIAQPEAAILTTAALVHACNFDSLEQIAMTKAEIFTHPQTKFGVIHRDLPNYDNVLAVGSCEKVSFSTTHPEADYRVEIYPDQSFSVIAEEENIRFSPLPVPGRHNIHNFLGAAALARYFGVTWDEMKKVIADLQLPDRRLQFVNRNEILFLNDAYNAAEPSVKAALDSLPIPKAGGSKIAVLGSMMELGKFSDECHKRVGAHALDCVEKVFCLGEECRPIYHLWKEKGRPVELFLDRAALVTRLKQVLKPADVVLLKGSRSKELWKVIEEL